LPGKARPFGAVIFYTRQTYTFILNLNSEPRKRTDPNSIVTQPNYEGKLRIEFENENISLYLQVLE
jgi:hypothetical protein